MEKIVIIAIFLVFTAAGELFKKKRRPAAPPADLPETGSKQDGGFSDLSDIIFGRRPQKRQADGQTPPDLAPQTVPTHKTPPRKPLRSPSYAAASPKAAAAPDKVQRDFHETLLMDAVMYAQILQPPKAYQYMATRSCQGEISGK